jgi:hypothetical protein
MNYDFQSNWDRIVLPLIALPVVQKSIKKGIQSWIKSQGSEDRQKYRKGESPASYSRTDGWMMAIDEYKETLKGHLISTGFIKEYEEKEHVYTDAELADDASIEDEFGTEAFQQYCDQTDKALEPFIIHYGNTSLRAYQMFGACHWWNPTFSLTLAKLIYPGETWIVKRGKEHTTVVNKNKTLVFDILYFDLADPTLGGATALTTSTDN